MKKDKKRGRKIIAYLVLGFLVGVFVLIVIFNSINFEEDVSYLKGELAQTVPYPGTSPSPSPTNSPTHGTTLYPTATPTPTISCSGEANYSKNLSTILYGNIFNTSQEGNRKNIMNTLLIMINQIMRDPTAQAFGACTYPPDFASKCPRPPCDVNLSYLLKFKLTPLPSITDSYSTAHTVSGTLTVTLSLLSGIGISPTPPTPPDYIGMTPEEQREAEMEYEAELNEWFTAVLNYGLKDVLKAAEKVGEDLRRKYPCPAGYDQIVNINIDFNNINWDISWTSMTITLYIPYAGEVKCIKTSGTQNTRADVELLYNKKCYLLMN